MYVVAADRQVRDIPRQPFYGFGGDDIQSARIVRTHPVAGFLNNSLEYTERAPCLVIVDRGDDSGGPDRGNDRKIVVGTQKNIVAPISIRWQGFLFDCQKFAVSEDFGEVFGDHRRNFLDRIFRDDSTNRPAECVHFHRAIRNFQHTIGAQIN